MLWRDVVTWGVHNSYVRQPLRVLGNHPQPNFVQQYANGARLFEVDVHWWQKDWLVAHFPVVDATSHVSTLAEAACTIRQLQGSVMFLDVKTTLWPCTVDAVRGLRRSLSACANWGALTVFMDVSCGGIYDNSACADALRRAPLHATRVWMRGIDWWWLRPRCASFDKSKGAVDMETKTPCGMYHEPVSAANASVFAPVPVLYECGDCRSDAIQHACVHHALRRPSAQAVIQTVSLM